MDEFNCLKATLQGDTFYLVILYIYIYIYEYLIYNKYIYNISNIYL